MLAEQFVYCCVDENGKIFREYGHTKFYERKGDAERCVERNYQKHLKVVECRLEGTREWRYD